MHIRKAVAAGRTYCLSRFAMRTKWIDDRILHAVSPRRDLQVRQVVVLGAGMDTRPWRLDLPAGMPCQSFYNSVQAVLAA